MNNKNYNDFTDINTDEIFDNYFEELDINDLKIKIYYVEKFCKSS